jgi:hypothetical protein
MHAEGQLWRRTDDTTVKNRLMSFSRSVEDQDLKDIVMAGYEYFADEMVSHLMELPALPPLPTVDESSSIDSQGRLKVALLPIEFTSTGDNSISVTPETVAEKAERVISDLPALELVGSDQIQRSDLLINNKVWTKSSNLGSAPNLDFIYSQGAEAGLDVAVMIFFSSDSMGYIYYNDAKLYVIDLRHRQVQHATIPTVVGDLDDLDIEKHLRPLLEKTVAEMETKNVEEVMLR